MESNPVQERVCHIVKSENDDRLYRGLKLTNGMKVLLISDPTTEKAAAALSVDAGSAADPPNLPGLSHLYQRLVYLTNENNEQKLFKTYVQDNNGEIDAKIQMEFAMYCFSINPNNFKFTLSCFAELFQKPLAYYSEAVIFNERYKVMMTELDDKLNFAGFIKYIREHHELPQHGLFKYSLETISMAERLKIFYDKYYCPELMKLCVLGKESLDELETMVVQLFSPMKRRDNLYSRNFMRNPSSVYKIYYVPHDAHNKLHITFHNNLSCISDFLCSPDHFLAYLLKYDGRGSLLSTLRAKGWSNFIEAGVLAETNNKAFIVTITLTEEGLEHIDDIMTLYFQYFNMLKESDEFTLRRLYNEYKEIQEIKFRLKEKETPLKYVMQIARSMQEQWPLKYVLCGTHIPINWNQESMQKIIENSLPPLRMSIYVGSKKYETIINSTDFCHNYNYKVEEVPIKTCVRWTKRYSQTEFDIPACNEFIPTTTNIKPHEENASQFPTIIKDTELLKLWHKKDDKFNEPKAIMIFQFINPLTYMDPLNAHFTCMFVDLINESLSEYIYPAALVGLHWELYATVMGIQLKISGFDNKQHLLLEKIIDRMINFKLNPINFEVKRENNKKLRIMELEELKEQEPYEEARDYLQFLLFSYDCMWQRKEMLELYDHVTFEKLDHFISKFCNSVYVEGLIHGNITRAEALNIADMIENKWRVPALSIKKMTLSDVRLQDACHYIFYKDTKFHALCTLVCYQIERESIKSEILLDFVKRIITKSCFKLIEKENEKVFVSIFNAKTVQALIIWVQDQGSYTPIDVEDKINNFMHFVLDTNAMSQETFEAEKASLIKYYNDKLTLNDLSNAFWDIIKREHDFDSIKFKIHTLYKITLQELYSFFKKFVDEKTPKLSIRLTSVPCKKDKIIVLDGRDIQEINLHSII